MIYKAGREVASEHYRLPDGSTVFQAEIMAIAKGAELLLGLDRDNIKYVKFFVDSRAAISAVDNVVIRSRAVAGAVDRLNELAGVARKVTINWIPAHKGHLGNERADDLAKLGSGETEGKRSLKIGRPGTVVKAAIKEHVHGLWGKEWTEWRSANHSKSFYSGPNKNKAKYVYKLARLELGRFARIITGHNNLGFFQAKLGLADNPMCRFCEEGYETIMHLLNECPRFMSHRRDIFRDDIPTNDMTWSVRKLLDFSYIPGINEAYEGSWTATGPPAGEGGSQLEVSLDLGWLEEDEAQ